MESCQAHGLRVRYTPAFGASYGGAQQSGSWREAAPGPLSFTPRVQTVMDRGFPAKCAGTRRGDACLRDERPLQEIFALSPHFSVVAMRTASHRFLCEWVTREVARRIRRSGGQHDAAWPHGRMAAWPHGRMAAWPHGRMAAWPHGRMAAWPHGRMAA